MRLRPADSPGLPRALRHAALGPLAERVDLSRGAVSGSLDLAVPVPCRLVLTERFESRAGALVLLRFGLELAVLQGIAALPAASATLLAARAAGMFLAVLPRAARDAALEDPAVPLLARLARTVPPVAQLAACWRLLAEAMQSAEAPPDLAALRLVSRLWTLAAPT